MRFGLTKTWAGRLGWRAVTARRRFGTAEKGWRLVSGGGGGECECAAGASVCWSAGLLLLLTGRQLENCVEQNRYEDRCGARTHTHTTHTHTIGVCWLLSACLLGLDQLGLARAARTIARLGGGGGHE